jgi:hypothetical protein
MGASLSPASECSVESLPGSLAAGLAFRKNTTTGALQVAAAGAGPVLGISMGRSLGKNGQFSGCYAAPKVALQLTGSYTPSVGAQVTVSDTTGKGASSGTAINAVYEKILVGGGVSEVDGSAVDVAIINMIGGP